MKQRSHRRVRPSMLTAAAGLVAGGLSAPALAQPVAWNAAVNGGWTTGANWNPVGVPNSATAAVTLGLTGGYTVSLQTAAETIGTLSIPNASATLFLVDNCNLSVSGATISNSGLIKISDPTSPGNATRITLGAPVGISGSGTLRLASTGNGDNTSSYIDYTSGANILTNAAGHTIAGRGRFYGPLVNNGTVTADQSGGLLVMLDQAKTNNATMQATNDGQLYLRVGLTQGAGGVLSTTGTNSAVVLQSGGVNGGTFSTGYMTTAYGTTNSLDNLTISAPATFQVTDNSLVNVSSNIVNNGTIYIQYIGAPGNATRISAAAPFAFSGSGIVRLQAVGNGDNTSAYLDYTVAANTITNGASNTIAGDGRIYAGLINNGTVDADQNGKLLIFQDRPATNAGVMRATNGGALYLRTSLTQTGSGNLQATGVGSTVVLQTASVSGGSMSTGLLQTAYGTSETIDAFTVAAPATLQINDNTLLNVGGSGLTNNGLVTIQTPGAPGNAARLYAAAPSVALNGSGTIRMQGTGNFNDSAYLYYTLGANVFTNAATHTIAGVGRIYANLVNNGVVTADTNLVTPTRNVMQLLDQPKTNNNLMKATGGGQLWLSGISVSQASGAILQADTGSAVVLSGATVNSGKLTSAGTGQFVTNYGTNNAIDGVTLTAGSLFQVGDNTTLLIRSSLVNNGTMYLQTIGAPGNAARAYCDSPAITLSGPGTIRLQATGNFNDSAYLYYNAFGSPTAIPGVFTNAAGHTIAGNGRLYTGIINNGTILADIGVAGRQVLQFLDQPKTNNSLIRATGGGQIYVTNSSISQSGSGQMVCDTGSTFVLQSAGFSGGTMTSSGTGLFQTIYGTANSVDGMTLATGSLFQISDNTTLNLGSGGLVNNGTVTVQTVGAPGNTARLDAPAAATISGTGTVRLQATGFSNDSSYLWGQGSAANPLTLGSGQTLSGSGRLYGNIVSQGLITPDQPFGATGVVGRIEGLGGSLTMAATSQYQVQATSASAYDQITGSDAVTVAGGLTVSASYTPGASDILAIVNGTSVTGTFSTVGLPTVGSFGPAHVVYTPTQVLVVMCYANCDGSSTAPRLNVADFTCFLQQYASGDPYANCDGSTQAPVLNVADFTCYLQKYANGCP